MARSVTGHSPQREQQLQERLIAKMERRFYRSFRTELNKAYKAIGRGVNPVAAMREHEQRMANLLRKNYTTASEEMGMRILRAAAKSYGVDIETKKGELPTTPIFDRLTEFWINEFVALKVTEITGTTREQVTSTVRRMTELGVQEGWGEAKLAREIEKEFNSLSRLRARMIARTETHAAANAAQMTAAKASGVIERKEWVAAGGGDTRAAHQRADGQIVNIDHPFIVDGERLRYAGDPSGSAENVINCRCATIYLTD